MANLPAVIGALLGALALATVAHLLITSVRRRRRDLAVLRAIGFTRGQVRVTVSWQAATLIAVALAIGVPAGIIDGRLVWLLFTGQLGVLPVLYLPWLAFVAFPVVAVVLSLAVAALPGESAARANPADILRSE